MGNMRKKSRRQATEELKAMLEEVGSLACVILAQN
jgi:hypothetical protein